MRFLVDNALSPEVSAALCSVGHDAVHVRDRAMQAAADEVIFELAAAEQRIVLSADTDFGTLLAKREVAGPSVILFRHGAEHRPAQQVALLATHLPSLADALGEGPWSRSSPRAFASGACRWPDRQRVRPS